jgi:hypothetical protein
MRNSSVVLEFESHIFIVHVYYIIAGRHDYYLNDAQKKKTEATHYLFGSNDEDIWL